MPATGPAPMTGLQSQQTQRQGRTTEQCPASLKTNLFSQQDVASNSGRSDTLLTHTILIFPTQTLLNENCGYYSPISFGRPTIVCKEQPLEHRLMSSLVAQANAEKKLFLHKCQSSGFATSTVRRRRKWNKKGYPNSRPILPPLRARTLLVRWSLLWECSLSRPVGSKFEIQSIIITPEGMY